MHINNVVVYSVISCMRSSECPSSFTYANFLKLDSNWTLRLNLTIFRIAEYS